MRLIDANALKEGISELKRSPWYNNEMIPSLHAGIKEAVEVVELLCIDKAPTIDAVPLDGSFLKMSKGDYLIYDRHWLYEHFDQEIDIQRSAMKAMGYEYVGKNTDAVRHGKWIGYAGTIGNECSVCGKWIDVLQGTAEMNYCPQCGARMDEDD